MTALLLLACFDAFVLSPWEETHPAYQRSYCTFSRQALVCCVAICSSSTHAGKRAIARTQRLIYFAPPQTRIVLFSFPTLGIDSNHSRRGVLLRREGVRLPRCWLSSTANADAGRRHKPGCPSTCRLFVCWVGRTRQTHVHNGPIRTWIHPVHPM